MGWPQPSRGGGMMEQGETPAPPPGRRENGTFAPGNREGGKPKGARNKTTLAVEALLDGEAEELTRKAIEKAKEGDMAALRLCLERILPNRKDSHITFDLPPVETAQDAEKASAALLAAVAAGEVTPGEGGAVMSLLVAHKSIVEAGDHERRLAELEARQTR